MTKRNIEPQNEMNLATNQLAELLGLSARRIQQLAEEGVIIKAGRGRYKAAESIQNYIRFLQEKERSANEGEADYFKERALHEKAKREMAEIELAVIKGEIHRSEDVKVVMNDMIAAFRSKVLALPTKLAPQLAGKTEIPIVKELLNREIREALTELAEYDPQVFYAKSTEYMDVKGDEEETE
jgi:phage terminase Nu1 subunit (DNA packaging protein)